LIRIEAKHIQITSKLNLMHELTKLIHFEAKHVCFISKSNLRQHILTNLATLV